MFDLKHYYLIRLYVINTYVTTASMREICATLDIVGYCIKECTLVRAMKLIHTDLEIHTYCMISFSEYLGVHLRRRVHVC